LSDRLPTGRFLEGEVVGDLGQPEGVPPVGPVAEAGLQAAVVGPEELAERPEGEEGRLGGGVARAHAWGDLVRGRSVVMHRLRSERRKSFRWPFTVVVSLMLRM
jgi:hypothetical protein